MCSSLVKPKTIKLVFDASLLSMQHSGVREKDGLTQNQDNLA